MATYRIEIKRSAAKELEAVPRKDHERIVAKIWSLAENPRSLVCAKLSGQEKYRIRQGSYRMLYEIFDEALVVVVVKIADRNEAYKP
jgi:mRNA interferase RelE/StbE